MSNIEETMSEIQYLEKAIKATEDLRKEALTMDSMWKTQVKEKDEELLKLNTTPEKGRKEVEDAEVEIAKIKEQIKSMLPIELLQKNGRL